jgi:hypothetical protein
MEQSDKIEKLAESLAAFQAEVGTIKRDVTVKVKMKSGGSYSYTYADMSTILNHCYPILTKHGLSISQSPDMLIAGDAAVSVLANMLMHKSGQWIRAHSPLRMDDDIKTYGGTITYNRRYALSIIGIVTDDGDPDRQDITQAKEDDGGYNPDSQPPDDAIICDCGQPMRIRYNKNDPDHKRPFYGCTDYPNCKKTRQPDGEQDKRRELVREIMAIETKTPGAIASAQAKLGLGGVNRDNMTLGELEGMLEEMKAKP